MGAHWPRGHFPDFSFASATIEGLGSAKIRTFWTYPSRMRNFTDFAALNFDFSRPTGTRARRNMVLQERACF
jgi:hypothetical protein